MGEKILFFAFLFSALLVEGIFGYSVSGNKILDASGKQVLLRGMNKCSFEWSATGEQASLADYTLMKNWGANVVRIPMNQGYWLSTSSSYVSGYKATIQQQIDWISSLGMGIILDLHWSDTGNLNSNPNQQCMADTNSVTFWTQVATLYKSRTDVIFELYNEPHDVSWSVWLNGGSGCGFTVAGMQQLYNAIRDTGANNIVIVNGLNWSFDLSGIALNPVVGSNIVYSTHPYDYEGKGVSSWDAAFGYLTSTYPVIATEFGQYCNTDTYVADLLTYMTNKGIHWTAWAWYVSGCSFPSIISDWSGTPTSPVGVLVKESLSSTSSSSTSGVINPTPAPTAAPTAQPASGSLVVYADALQNNFQSYGWASDLSFSATAYTYGGSNSISFTPSAFAGVYMHTTTSFNPAAYTSLQFYVNGGSSSSQSLKVVVYDTSASPVATGNAVVLPNGVKSGTWVLQSISISSFGLNGRSISGFAIQGSVAGSQAVVYIDNISFIASSSSSTTTGTGSSTSAPTAAPSNAPTATPTGAPTTKAPTATPTGAPTTKAPTGTTSGGATTNAPTSAAPSVTPSAAPSATPSAAPSVTPSAVTPTVTPTAKPTSVPTKAPTSIAMTVTIIVKGDSSSISLDDVETVVTTEFNVLSPAVTATTVNAGSTSFNLVITINFADDTTAPSSETLTAFFTALLSNSTSQLSQLFTTYSLTAQSVTAGAPATTGDASLTTGEHETTGNTEGVSTATTGASAAAVTTGASTAAVTTGASTTTSATSSPPTGSTQATTTATAHNAATSAPTTAAATTLSIRPDLQLGSTSAPAVRSSMVVVITAALVLLCYL